MTRAGRRIDPCELEADEGDGGSAAPFLSIFVNNIVLTGAATENTPPDFIVNALATRGGIAYLRDVNRWAEYIRVGRNDVFHMPKYIRLYGDNQVLSDVIAVDGSSVCVFPANAQFYPPVKEIKARTRTLKETSINLMQNLKALRQATAIIYDDAQLKPQIEEAERKRLAGASHVSIKADIGSNLRIENFSPNAVSHIADYIALWTQTTEELDSIVGVAHLGEKNERRIESEVNIIENSASAIIDLLCESINKYARYYNVDIYADRKRLVKLENTPTTGENEEGDPNE